MKRVYLWVRELSLTQQLLSIAILAIAGFTFFLSVFLSPSIDAFTENEMFRIIHASQDTYLVYLEKIDDVSDIRGEMVYHTLYDERADRFTGVGDMVPDTMVQDDIKRLLGTEEGILGDHVIETGRRLFAPTAKILYTTVEYKPGTYLISYLPSDFENDFRASLVINVVNINVIIVAVLFILLILWVVSLIRPLYQIRNYINKIKNDEPAVLNIRRRDEIGEVASALTDMQAELQKQQQSRQEMIQNISHDLKTPIATIKSYSESIKDGVYPYGTLNKSIDVIIEHADRLEKKVRSLITLNKMEYLLDELPEGDNLNMNQLIDKVLLSLSVIRPEITFQRELDDNVCFHGDEEPWRIVIENLIDNALRYAHTMIRIVLHEGELKVINDGSQIDEEHLASLFRPYEKGSDGKFGLGLSIVWKVATTYGYRVEAENLQNGVSFRVWREITKKDKKNKEREKKGSTRRKK